MAEGSKQSTTEKAGRFWTRQMPLELSTVKAETAACTIITKNCLAMARVLAESFARHNPGSNFFVLLMDPVEGCFNPAQEGFHVVEARHLGMPHLQGMLFKYDLLEASAAMKPFFLEYLLGRHEIKKLVYLDPDILVLNTFEGVWRALEESAIALTPHITRVYPDEARPNEHDLLVAGSYNLGFLGMQNSATARQFLSWLQRMVCQDRPALPHGGRFMDQKWVDLLPGLYRDVKILREPGYNVAYWNLHERQITLENDEVRADGEPCYFFHFSGFDPAEPAEISKDQTRYKMSALGAGRELYRRYRSLLLKHGWNQSSRWAYTYDYFDSGERIPKSARRYYWSLTDQTGKFGDPFSWFGVTHRAEAATAHGSLSGAADATKNAEGSLPFGVNVVGHVTSEKGVGEVARGNLRILQAGGVPCIANNFIDIGSNNLEVAPAKVSKTNDYCINLINVNPDEMPKFMQKNSDYLPGHYNIGYWLWELSEFPEQWYDSFEYLDEVWVPSRFVEDCIAAVAPVPVKQIACCIDPNMEVSPAWIAWTRSRLKLNPDVYVFMFVFDFHSFLERKNPLGLIRAFRQAFGDRTDVLLLIKSSHVASDESGRKLMQTEGRGANIRLLDEVLPREAMRSLMSLADCYVSLHRSEGFGLTMSEAMQHGKPVIATGYSGNVDFMTDENSFLVRYQLKEIEQSYGPYRAGWVWADPDEEHAAELMRYVFEHREAAARVGERARSDVIARLHPRTLADEVKARLKVIQLEGRAVAAW